MDKVRTQLLATAAVVALTGAPALAADMAVKAPPPPPPVAAPSWTGFYLGGNVGVAVLNSGANSYSVSPGPDGNRDCSTSSPTGPFPSCSLQASSVAAGFQGGYDWQFNNVVLGVAADWSWTNLSQSQYSHSLSNPFVTAKVDWMASFRGRLGWAWDNQTLLYATGGWALAGLKSSEGSAFGCCDTHTTAINTTQGGWVVGGGLEHKLTEHVSVIFEGLYYDFGKATSPVAPTKGESFTYQTEFSNTVFEARVGMNYRF